jgi:DNA-binding SARP family transcriptional activator
MARLTLRLLGTPEVQVNGRPAAFPTRKALALLVYLAVAGGTHLREKLIALFWPDSDSTQGRASLRTTLGYIRATLGDAATHLVTDRDAVAFDPAPDLDFDLQTLQSPISNLQSLTSAASLLRGEFLEGFSLSDAPEFDDWAGLQREIWHRAGTQLLDTLSQLQSDGGQLRPAIETAARWIALDPLDESAHRRLMQLHFAAGDAPPPCRPTSPAAPSSPANSTLRRPPKPNRWPGVFAPKPHLLAKQT